MECAGAGLHYVMADAPPSVDSVYTNVLFSFLCSKAQRRSIKANGALNSDINIIKACRAGDLINPRRCTVAQGCARDDCRLEPLFIAVELGNPNSVQCLVNESGADVYQANRAGPRQCQLLPFLAKI